LDGLICHLDAIPVLVFFRRRRVRVSPHAVDAIGKGRRKTRGLESFSCSDMGFFFCFGGSSALPAFRWSATAQDSSSSSSSRPR